MKTSEILNLAADQIERRGWVTGSAGWNSYNENAPLCLEGGIQAAMGLNWSEVLNEETGEVVEWRGCPAYLAVNEYLGKEATYPLWRFNDRESFGAEHVVEVLRGAALVEAAKEEALEEVSA